MNPFSVVGMALHAIRGNLLRSALTALGVIIGVATVIAIVALGQGARQQITDQIQSLGTNLITASANPRQGAVFDAAMAADLATRAPDIVATSPLFDTGTTVAVGSASDQPQLEGTSAQWLSMRSLQLAGGAFFTSADVDDHAEVAVLGQTVLTNLGLNVRSAIGQQIVVGGQPVTVIGVLDSIGGGLGGSSPDDIVVMPYSTVEIIGRTAYPNQLLFEAKSAADAPLVVGTLQEIFDVMFPRANAVFVQSQDQLLSTLSAATQTETVTLGAIAAISLLVGGIGIMNIMLVSVTERTREIGLRKAIGAKRWAILLQFLLEAGLLAGTGGLVGVLLGTGGARVLGHYLKTVAVVTPLSVVVGLGFSVVVGLVFGYWPALGASRLDPIVALRHE